MRGLLRRFATCVGGDDVSHGALSGTRGNGLRSTAGIDSTMTKDTGATFNKRQAFTLAKRESSSEALFFLQRIRFRGDARSALLMFLNVNFAEECFQLTLHPAIFGIVCGSEQSATGSKSLMRRLH